MLRVVAHVAQRTDADTTFGNLEPDPPAASAAGGLDDAAVRPRSAASLGLIRRGLDQDPIPSKGIEKICVTEADAIIRADLDVPASPAAAEESVDQDVLAILGRHHRRKPEIA